MREAGGKSLSFREMTLFRRLDSRGKSSDFPRPFASIPLVQPAITTVMKRTLVAFYSHSGNNHYLAHRIARRLQADVAEIRPRGDSLFLQVIFSWLRISLGMKPFEQPLAAYDRVLILGPIWMGMLIAPLRQAIRRCRLAGVEMHFVTCCGGHDGMKDERFGYETVFRQARKVGGPLLTQCLAFPVTLTLPPDQRDEQQAGMNTRLSDETFTGELLQRFDAAFPRRQMA